jgi:hypothetical protein
MLKQENHMTSKQHPTHADTDRSYSSAVNMIAQAQREVNRIWGGGSCAASQILFPVHTMKKKGKRQIESRFL